MIEDIDIKRYFSTHCGIYVHAHEFCNFAILLNYCSKLYGLELKA